MLKRINFELSVASKTYATEADAIKAAERVFGQTDLRYFITQVRDWRHGMNLRYIPVFVGEEAIRAGAHRHFHVVG